MTRLTAGSVGRCLRQPGHGDDAPPRSGPCSRSPPGPRWCRWPAACPTWRRCPLETLADTVARLIRERGSVALQYGSGQGESALREQILEVMAEVGVDRAPRRRRGHRRLADGARPGDPGLLRPRRRRAGRGALATSARWASSAPTSATSSTSPMDEDGLVPEALDEAITRVRCQRPHVEAHLHDPDRSTTRPASPRAQRSGARGSRDRAARRALLVLEDDPYGLLGFDGDGARAPSGPTTPTVSSTSARSPRRIAAGPAGGLGGRAARRAREARARRRGRHPVPVQLHASSPCRSTWPPSRGVEQVKTFREVYRERRDALLDSLDALMPAGHHLDGARRAASTPG